MSFWRFYKALNHIEKLCATGIKLLWEKEYILKSVLYICLSCDEWEKISKLEQKSNLKAKIWFLYLSYGFLLFSAKRQRSKIGNFWINMVNTKGCIIVRNVAINPFYSVQTSNSALFKYRKANYTWIDIIDPK